MTRYIIIGAGAVGASLATEFERAGIAYGLVGRGSQIQHIRQHGLNYRRPSGVEKWRLTVFDAENPPELRPDDILILTVKAQDVEATTADWATRPIGNSSELVASLPIVTFQNGLSSEAIALRRFDKVYSASIMTPALFVETGKVVAAGNPQVGAVVLGRYPKGSDEITTRIAGDLGRANYLAEVRDDIQRWKAAKLILNVRNAVELFTGSVDAMKHAADRLSKEADVVLKAAGYAPAHPDERKVSIGHWHIAENSGYELGQQSTWQSFTRGASSEVDYLNGEVVRLGRLLGIPTPLNLAVQRAATSLKQQEGVPGVEAISSIFPQTMDSHDDEGVNPGKAAPAAIKRGLIN